MRRVCLDMVHQLARRDERVVYIGSDPAPGTLEAMRDEFPDRVLIEGISEGNVIGMAAGMALEGFIPYVNTIATFITRRAFEQIAIDVCLHELPVRFIGNGGGMVYAPLGATHTAIEDIATMRALPQMTIVCPTDAHEMVGFMEQTLDWPQPIYIRLGKGGDAVVTADDALPFTIGKAIERHPPGDITFLATGVMTQRALEAACIIKAKGVSCGVISLPTVCPLDEEAIATAAKTSKVLVSVEEGIRSGGMGGSIVEFLADRPDLPSRRVLRLGLPGAFVHTYGTQNEQLANVGLAPQAMAQTALDALSETL